LPFPPDTAGSAGTGRAGRQDHVCGGESKHGGSMENELGRGETGDGAWWPEIKKWV
jgi:hypothetical protein